MDGNAMAGPRMGAMEAFARGIPAEMVTFVKRTYSLLAFSLILGAAACWSAMQLLPVRVSGTRVEIGFPIWILWALWGGTIVFSLVGQFVRSGSRQGEASVLGLLALVGMVLCSGAMIGPTISMYVGLGMASTVMAAALVTAVTFTAMTAFVLLTGHRFGFLGGILFVASMGILVALVVNALFVRSAGLDWWLSAAMAVLFCGYILFHTSLLVHTYGPANMVVPAVISLYLDILNLFLLLLRLMASNRRERS
jgi:FtsH-binding integral membrane protein